MKSTFASTSGYSQRHILSLDGIRGIAIGLVLMVHLLWANTETGSSLIRLVGHIRAAGWVGVDLFFSLSGFLITGILFDSLHSNHYFKNFYARRILRIFPLYYGVILVLFVVFRPHNFAQGRPLFLLLAYLQNTPLWWNGINPPLIVRTTDHLWSLAVEEQFYLVWPILIFLIRDRRKLLWVALTLAALAPVTRAIMLAHGASFGATYNITICRADSLLGGAWLALMMRGGLRTTVLRYASTAFAAALLGCAMIAWRTGSFDWQLNRPINLYGYSIVAIGSTALIAMALRPGSYTSRMMQLRFLRFLGRYSYGIYIFHIIVFTLMSVTITPFLMSHIHSKILYHLVLMITVLLITIPLAMLSFEFYEKPFLKLKKRFGDTTSPTAQEIPSLPLSKV
jgi:peptidoglycan/LPS O-acetylase OafA/YrhL